MWPTLLIVIYSVCLLIASLIGGWLPRMIQMTHTRMQWMMSFVGGLMMGVAVLHLLPHAAMETGSLDYAAWSCTAGLLAMFLTIRVFQVHHHGPVSEEGHRHGHEPEKVPTACNEAACSDSTTVRHDHHEHPHPSHAATPHHLSWFGLFFGLAIHSLIDGLAVAASVTAAAEHRSEAVLLGAGAFLAVLLHKPLDSMSITSVMMFSKWSRRECQWANVVFALICPVGAIVAFFGFSASEMVPWQHVVVGCALGFSGGVFLCISLADILPEIQFHRHDRTKLFTAILLGVALACAIGLVETPHQHDPSHLHLRSPSEADHR